MEQFKLDSHTAMYGVIGDPIRHSRSPIMLNRAFAAKQINAAYAAFHVRPEQLEQAMNGMRALQFGGLNVTIPHKVAIMDYLDQIDESARAIGAVNTIVNHNDRWIGYNTDGIGYVRSLKEETGIALKNKHIVVIGAGGAARGIVYALAQEQPAIIYVINRTEARAVQLVDSMGEYAPMRALGLDAMQRIEHDIDLVINTTDIGMHPHVDAMPIDAAWLQPHMTVSDIIYNPRQTKLLTEAKRVGCQIHGGLGMFIYQGAYAFEYWTGEAAPVAAMRHIVEQSLAKE